MPSLGPMEILMIAIVALIVFGPEKLPQIARQVGRYAAELRRMASEVRDEFESSIAFDDEPGDEIIAPEEKEAPESSADEDDEEDEPAKDKPADPDDVEH